MGASWFGERRALSLRRRGWQSVLASLLLPATAFAAPGGDIGTMPIGDYVCELPGDALGPAGRHVPEEDFTVVTASSYRAQGTMGSYLLTGNLLTMTSGPHQGNKYRRRSEGFLRKLDASGAETALRCVRRKRNNS